MSTPFDFPPPVSLEGLPMIPEEELRRLQSEALERDALAERELFLLGMPPAPEVVVEEPLPEPTLPAGEPVDTLGLTIPLSQAEIVLGYEERARELKRQQLVSTLPEAAKQKDQADLRRQLLERSVTPEGRDIGSFGISDILLNTDGYIVGEDGRPRKASGRELLLQQFGRQVLYEGDDFDRRIAELQAARKVKYQQNVAAGMTPEEAEADLDSWFDGKLSEIDEERRQIVETPLAAFMRGALGIAEATSGEFIFDTMPLFYEVDEQGDLQNPDDLADNIAYLVDRSRKAVADATGVEVSTLDKAQRFVGDVAMRAYAPSFNFAFDPVELYRKGKFERINTGDIVPLAFKPIDRDAPTSFDEAGKRVAASTGGFFSDVAMNNARGRSLLDEVNSIPSYTDHLGDRQYLSFIPALMGGIALPIVPGANVTSAASSLAKAGVFGARVAKGAKVLSETGEMVSRATSPRAWYQAHMAHRELSQLVGDGMETASVVDILLHKGEPARAVAANIQRQLSAPFTMRAALLDDAPFTYDHIIGLAETSDVGRHILNRAGAQSWAVASEADELTLAHRVALEEAILEWRLGLESSTVREALRPDGGNLMKVVEDLLGPDQARRVLNADSLYADALDASKKARGADEVADLFRDAANTAGSAAVRTSNQRVRMMLSLADETSALGASRGMKANSPLKGFFRLPTETSEAARDLAKAPAAVQYGSALGRAFQRTVEEMVDAHVPRDMRFVTDRLMVPRELATAENMRRVGEGQRAIYQAYPAAEEGMYDVLDSADDVLDMLNVVDPRRPQRVELERALFEDKKVTLTQHAYLEDAARELVWRRIIPDRDVAEAAFETRTSMQAGRAVGPGGQSRKAFMQQVVLPVMDTVSASLLAATSATRGAGGVVSRLGAAEAGEAIVRASRRVQAKWDSAAQRMWLQSTSATMPSTFRQGLDQVSNAMGVVQRQYNDEIMQLTAQLRREGVPFGDAGKEALDVASTTRWARVGQLVEDRFFERVRKQIEMIEQAAIKEPMRRPPSEAEVAALLLYQDGGARGGVSIGAALESVRQMDEGAQAQFLDNVRKLVRRGEYRAQWSRLMQDFFTSQSMLANVDKTEAVIKRVDAHIDKYIQAGQEGVDAVKRARQLSARMTPSSKEILNLLDEMAKAAILEPTHGNIQKVIARLRDDMPETLGRRGAARISLASLFKKGKLFADAILETQQSWQLAADRRFAVTQIWDDLFRRNPELRTALTPTATADTEFGVSQMALRYGGPNHAVTSVLDRLRTALGEEFPTELEEAFVRAMNKVFSPETLRATGAEPHATGLADPVLEPMLSWARKRMQHMSSEEQLNMVESVFDAMQADGTLYPSVRLNPVGGTSGSRDVQFAKAQIVVLEAQQNHDLKNPVSIFMRDAVRELKSRGMANGAIQKLIAEGAERGIEAGLASFVGNQARATMRTWGFSSFATPGALDQVMATVLRIPTDPDIAYPVLPGMEDVLTEMKSGAANGSLLSTLQNIHSQTLLAEGGLAGPAKFILRSLSDVAVYGRQAAAYGLLSAGIVLGGPLWIIPGIPIVRYVGLNLLTAPMMMVGTLGYRQAAKSLAMSAKMAVGDVASAVKNKTVSEWGRALVDTVSPRKPDDFLFTDVYGKEWTVREFEEMAGAYNYYMSRGDVDQAADMLRTIQRDIGVISDAELDSAPWWKMARKLQSSLFDPSRTSISMQLATWTDTVFRRGTFASAIRDGMSPMQAAELARASVLDYGAVPDVVKQSINRYALFATFRMASMREILMAGARGQSDWLRVLRVQMQMQKAAGTWTYGSDYDRIRQFAIPGPDFDYRGTAVAGPQGVFPGGMADLIDLSFFAMGSMAQLAGKEGAAGDIVGRVVDAVLEEQIRPEIQMVLALAANTRPSSRGRLVPDTWAVAFQNAGPDVWEWAVDAFDIKDIGGPLDDRDERRPGASEFRNRQYVFEQNGFRNFQAFTFLATQLMIGRATQDTTKTAIAAGYGPDGYDPKYRGTVPWLMYLVGAGTPVRVKSPEDVYSRSFRRDYFATQ